jgi:tetratricopeptide (TPR) repeat protein
VAAYEDIRSGLELNETSWEFARRRGMTHHVMWTRAARLWLLYDLGEWDELLAESEEVVRWDRSQGGTQIELNALIASAPVRAQRRDLEEALRSVAFFLPRAREVSDPQTLAPALAQAALTHAVAGNLEEAIALTNEFERTTRGRPSWRAGGISALTRVCAAAGEIALAEKLVEDTPLPLAAVSRRSAVATGRAVLAEARGEMREAAALYREAADGWERWGSVVERGYALLDLGRCGDAAAAREGSAIFERLGAVPFTALAA